MYRICLIDMPFASIQIPSIALTQIKNILESSFPGRVAVELLYVKNDFATYFGVELYDYIATSMQSLNTGLGDWLFRGVAFPELPDNTTEYLRRYSVSHVEQKQEITDLVIQKRPRFKAFFSKLINKYRLDKANLVGFTSMFMQNAATFAMAKLLKQRNPRVLVVIGGANCEHPMGSVIARCVPEIDFVFSGPALISFPKFVERELDGNHADVCKIPGVLSRDNVEELVPDAVIGEDLSIDTVIELDYDSFLDQFALCFPRTKLQCSLPFETSRGCWWGQRAHCTFCGLNGASMAYRSMRADLAIQQVTALFRYAGRAQQLQAVDNILPKSYLQEVLPYLATPHSLELFYEVKADLSEEEVATLAKARVARIQPGIEALATSTLKLMKKGTTSFQNVRLLMLCVQYGVTPCWNLLVGFPGEAEDVYRRYIEIIPHLAHLAPPSGVFPVRFDRFSPYFHRAAEYELKLVPLDYYSLIYPFSFHEMESFAYYFGDNNFEAKYLNVMTKWIDQIRLRIAEWQAKWRVANAHMPPTLHFKSDPCVVYDSRSGTGVEHQLSALGRRILDYLSRPTRKEDLLKKMEVDGVPSELAILSEKGLIFEEDQRLLSLVLEMQQDEKGINGLSESVGEYTMQHV
jgi:ribosomal peptide maturation radical SAM protein 1